MRSLKPLAAVFLLLYTNLPIAFCLSEICAESLPFALKNQIVYQTLGDRVVFSATGSGQGGVLWVYQFSNSNGTLVLIKNSEIFSEVSGSLVLNTMVRKLNGATIRTAVLSAGTPRQLAGSKNGVTIHVGEKPSISLADSILSVKEGADYFTHFPINVTASPKSNITLADKDGRPADGNKLSYNETHLSIKRFSASDSPGKYVFEAANCFGKGRYEFTVRIQVPVKLVGSPSGEIREVSCGNSVLFECTAEGYPPPSITWTQNSTPISSKSKFLSDDDHVVAIQSNSTILVDRSNIGQSEYTCHASGVGSSISRTFRLSVSCKPGTCSMTVLNISNVDMQAEIELPADNGETAILSYKVAAERMSNSSDRQTYNVSKEDARRPVVFTGLTPRSRYVLFCIAYNKVGPGPLMKIPVQNETKDVPGQPDISQTSTSCNAAKVSFSAVDDGESPITLYEISYADDRSPGEWNNSQRSPHVNESGLPSYELENLETDTKYSWKVRAKNMFGWSKYSNTGSFTTSPCARDAQQPSSTNEELVIIISSCAGVAAVGLLVAVILLSVRKQRRRRKWKVSIRLKNRQVVANKWRREMASKSGVNMVVDARHLKLGEIIGEGAFGCVFEGTVRGIKSQPVRVAVKAGRANDAENELNDLLCECSLMKTFHHPNVLHLIGVCVNYDPENFGPLIIVPFMDHGDVKRYVTRRRLESGEYLDMKECEKHTNPNLSLSFLLRVCLQIAAGMSYLTIKNVVHRDLAARNCMLNRRLVVKVADFGLSRSISTSSYYKVKTSKKLPIKWLAPECLTDRKFTQQSDVWAFGVTAWEVFALGIDPYPGVQNFEVLSLVQRGLRLDQPKSAPDDVYQILKTCWQLEPSRRPKFVDLHRRLEAVATKLVGYEDFDQENEIAEESPEEYYGSESEDENDKDEVLTEPKEASNQYSNAGSVSVAVESAMESTLLQNRLALEMGRSN